MRILKRIITIHLFLIPSFSLGADQPQIQSNGVEIVTLGERNPVNEIATYPIGGLANKPLLVAAHGNGGSGRSEINDWVGLARKHHFTIVCPTFLSAIHSKYIPEDVSYFRDCLRWIKDNLRYDKNNVFMTGFSGGGYAVWYLGTTRPDFFKGLFLQSGNFAGSYYNLDLDSWSKKPIHLIWGTEDSPTVIEQNREAAILLNAKGFQDFSTEIIPGAHHEPHHSLVVTWMEHQLTE